MTVISATQPKELYSPVKTIEDIKEEDFEDPLEKYCPKSRSHRKPPARNFKWSREDSDIVNFYKHRSIFVTGATGFLGKVLVEKLLRACTGIETIYILMRSKKGKDIHTRIEEIYSDPVFSRLAKQQPKFRHKIVPITGDCGLAGLGISPSDRELIKSKVSVIFHVAATVRFDEKLKLAAEINVRGTKEVLQLARECPHLVAHIHTSTAFSYCPLKKIDEVFYKPPFTTQEIMDVVENTPAETLEKLGPRLLGKFPNTYAFTKAISEDTVREFGQGLPVAMVRPSIVVPTYQEPLRGWTDNLYGPSGVLVGAGTGVLRSLYCNDKLKAEIVPVDLLVNSMIAISYKTYLDNNRKEIPIYNYVSTVENPLTWGEYMEDNKNYGLPVPTMRCFWYYNFTLNRYWLLHKIYVLFLHYLPALIADTVSWISGNKEISMLSVYRKIDKFVGVIEYFTTQEWKFTNDNTQSLWKMLKAEDKSIFQFNIKDLDWDYHAQTQILGLRVYVVKDDVSTLPQARKKWFRLKILHYTITYLFFGFALLYFFSLVYRIISSI